MALINNSSKNENTSSKRKQPDSVEDENEEIYSDDEGGIHIDGIYVPPPSKPACSLKTTGPRLIITYIKNNFFKSYGENVVLGPFYKVRSLV